MSKIEHVVRAIEQQIETGALVPGARLPSIRRAAAEFGLAKNTIVEAYGRLAARLVIQPRTGAGFFVADNTADSKTSNAPVVEASDTISLLRAQLTQEFAVRPGDGRAPLSWMRDALPKRIDTDMLSTSEGDQTGYGSPMGHSRLRELIARRYAVSGAKVAPSQIVTTFGANHALDLIIRRYLSPGDTVLVDDPGYYPLFAKLRLARINAIGVPRKAGGPDVEILSQLAAAHAPAFFFTQSTAQNPTGTSYDLPTAHATLQIAARQGFRVVDDDPFTDLHGQSVAGTRLWELDGFGSVIGVGTYSKVLSASFRSGYIVCDQRTADTLAEFKMITTVNSSRLSEMLIARMIESRRFDRHLRKLGQRLDEARRLCLEAFEGLGLRMHCDDPTGFYTMLYLPPETNLEEMQSHAAKSSIFLAPGQWFSPNTANENVSMRINFSRVTDRRFFVFLQDMLQG